MFPNFNLAIYLFNNFSYPFPWYFDYS